MLFLLQISVFIKVGMVILSRQKLFFLGFGRLLELEIRHLILAFSFASRLMSPRIYF